MINYTTNKNALRKFLRVLKATDGRQHLQRWLDDCSQPIGDFLAYYSVTDGRTSGFALLRKCEVDTFQQHKDPWLIEFIYVCQGARRCGVASRLVKHISHAKKELTALCSNEESTLMFETNAFTRFDVSQYDKDHHLHDTLKHVNVMRFPLNIKK
jgi:GNAT superfamily N-acetyltransferase